MSRRPGEPAFDWWSIPHAAAGIVLAFLGLPWFWAVAIIVGYEGVEAGLRRIPRSKVRMLRISGTPGEGLFENESWPNIGVDILLAISTYALTTWIFPGVDVWP